MMGLAGSGKGTQSQLLAKELNYDYLSTGEYLRTYLSEDRKKEILAGKLVDDQEMITIIRDFLAKTDKEVILDGFPRSLEQAKWLLDKHLSGEIQIEALVYLNVPESELIVRLKNRGRADDTEEAIKTRFEEYRKSTSPIIDHYKSSGVKIVEVDGRGTIEQIQKNILDQLR